MADKIIPSGGEFITAVEGSLDKGARSLYARLGIDKVLTIGSRTDVLTVIGNVPSDVTGFEYKDRRMGATVIVAVETDLGIPFYSDGAKELKDTASSLISDVNDGRSVDFDLGGIITPMEANHMLGREILHG